MDRFYSHAITKTEVSYAEIFVTYPDTEKEETLCTNSSLEGGNTMYNPQSSQQVIVTNSISHIKLYLFLKRMKNKLIGLISFEPKYQEEIAWIRKWMPQTFPGKVTVQYWRYSSVR